MCVWTVKDLHVQCTVIPSEQLASSDGFRVVMLQSSEAVSRQNAVTLFSQCIVVHGVPLRQVAGVAPRHQCVFQHSVPLFVPQKNLAPLLTRNLRGRIRRYGLGWHNETLTLMGETLWAVFNTSVRKAPFMMKNKAQLEKNSRGELKEPTMPL